MRGSRRAARAGIFAVLVAAAVAAALAAAAVAAPASAPVAAPQQIPQVRPRLGDPCNMGNLSQQILLKPSDVHALLLRAYCYLNGNGVREGKPPRDNVLRAVADLETVLKIDPQNDYAHQDYADAARLLGYDDFAEAEYTKAIALNPRDARGYLGRGWSRSDLCQMNDATADFAKAVQLDGALAQEVEAPQAIRQRNAQCSRRKASPLAARNCPPKHIVAFSLSARIVLEDEWKRQHPGCP